MYIRTILAFLVFTAIFNNDVKATSCNLNITVQSESSVMVDFEAIKYATSYSVTFSPRHDSSRGTHTVNTTTTTSVQVYCLQPDTLYDVSAAASNSSWTAGNCTALTYPAPIKVVVEEDPQPNSAIIFVGSNPRVTQWQIDIRKVRNWTTTTNQNFGFILEDLIPNTEYQVRARPSQINGEPVYGRTEFGEWTTFRTGMLSVFGKVTMKNKVYGSINDLTLTKVLTNASMELGNFSELSIIKTENQTDTGLITVHYEIKAFETTRSNITNFTLTADDFMDSAINNGDKPLGTFYWNRVSSTDKYQAAYYRKDNDPYCTVERVLEGSITYTSQSGAKNSVSLRSLISPSDGLTSGNACLREFTLTQNGAPLSFPISISNAMDNNAVYGIGIIMLKEVPLDKRENISLYTEVYEGNTTNPVGIQKQFIFTKNIVRSSLRINDLKYIVNEVGDSATVFIWNVPKSIRYQILNGSNVVKTLTDIDIDGSEFLKVILDNLTPNATVKFDITVTALTHEGNVTVSDTFNITTDLAECPVCGLNQTCYRYGGRPSVCDCDVEFVKNENDTACTKAAGGNSCNCDQGFIYNGTDCDDVDECMDGSDPCLGNATCNNTVGGYICTCSAGFMYNVADCEDIDECMDGSDPCLGNATCNNIIGGYNCSCPVGSIYNGVGCELAEPISYNTSLLDATTLEIHTNWRSGITFEISLDSSQSNASLKACGNTPDNRITTIIEGKALFEYLHPGNAYRVIGRRDDNHAVILNETIVTGAVSSPVVKSLSGTSSIDVSWNKQFNGTSFFLSLTASSYNLEKSNTTTETGWSVNGLDSGRVHQLCIQVLYCVSPPGHRNCTDVYTLPSFVTNINISSTSNSITLEWSPPKGATQYVVSLSRSPGVRSKRSTVESRNNDKTTKETNETTLVFDSLEASTKYVVSIAAGNLGGFGAPIEREASTQSASRPYTWPWWWIVVGVLLAGLVIIIIVLVVKYRQHEGNETDKRSCGSCWRALFTVQGSKSLQENEQENAGRCCYCWRAIFSIDQVDHEQQQNELQAVNSHHYESPSSGDFESACWPWRRVLNIKTRERQYQARNSGGNHGASSTPAENGGVASEHTYDEASFTPEMPETVGTDGMSHEQPPAGCCGWRAIFWINRKDN